MAVPAERLSMDGVGEFLAAIRAAGLEPPEHLEPGKFYRFPGQGKARSNSAAWCRLFPDGMGGCFGDWSTGLSETWQARRERRVTKAERRALQRHVAQAKAQAAAEREAAQTKAAAYAAAILNAAQPAAADHPYLRRKQVRPHGLKHHSGRLVVPLRDATGALCSLQFIEADGAKRFLPGGRTRGCYYAIGRPGETLLLAEGVATAAALHEATGCAAAVAFSAANLRPVAQALREKFPEAQLIIAADDDVRTPGNPGIAKAREAAEAVGAALAVPEFGDNRPDGASDFNDLAQHCGADAVRRCIEQAQKSHSDLGEPEPLRRPLPEADEYPFDALGDVLAPAARSLAQTVQAPDAIIGASLLVAASLVAMAHADVHIDGRRVPLSIWAVSIAESGDRKSAVDELALRRHRSAERAEAQVYEMRRREFDIETQAHEAIARAARTAKKGRTEEDIKAALGGLNPPDAPLLPWLMAAEPTVEGLHRLLAEGRGYGGLMSDDGGDMLGGHSMSADHRMRTAAALSHLWDRGEYDRVRGGDGANKYYGRRLALHLMVQPVVAESILSDPMLTGQGFLARCLLAWPASLAGSRPYVQRDLSADPAMVRYWQRMGDLLDRPPPLAEGQRNELAPRPLRLTADAKALWVQIHDGIEAKMAPNNALASVKAWAAKGAEQILRVAGVLTLVHDPSADTIDAGTIKRAGDVVAWHLGEAARIVGTASVPTEIRQAEAVLQWARESNIWQVHSRHLLRFGPGCVRTSDALRSAMAVLVRHGYASELPPGTVIDGKPRRSAWEII